VIPKICMFGVFRGQSWLLHVIKCKMLWPLMFWNGWNWPSNTKHTNTETKNQTEILQPEILNFIWIFSYKTFHSNLQPCISASFWNFSYNTDHTIKLVFVIKKSTTQYLIFFLWNFYREYIWEVHTYLQHGDHVLIEGMVAMIKIS
jgi:hypothetical protein